MEEGRTTLDAPRKQTRYHVCFSRNIHREFDFVNRPYHVRYDVLGMNPKCCPYWPYKVEDFFTRYYYYIKTSSSAPSWINKIAYKFLSQPNKHLILGKLKKRN